MITLGFLAADVLGGDGNDTLIAPDNAAASGNITGFETLLVGRSVSISSSALIGLTSLGSVFRDGRKLTLSGGDDSVYDFSAITLVDGGSLEFRAGGRIVGTVGSDTLTGTLEADRIDGNAGDDVIEGGGDLDTILGGDGNDRLSSRFGVGFVDGGAGDDTLTGGGGADTLLGGDGDDLVEMPSGQSAVAGERLEGGAGSDTLRITDSFTRLAGVATSGFETLLIADRLAVDTDDLIGVTRIGNSFGEGRPLEVTAAVAGTYDLSALLVTDAPLLFRGSLGDDSVIGSALADSLLGGRGGNDTLRGGDGDDTINGADTVSGGDGLDLIDGGDGDDRLFVGINDTAEGGAGDDLISYFGSGPSAATRIDGGDGNDTLIAGGSTLLLGVTIEGMETLLVSGVVTGSGSVLRFVRIGADEFSKFDALGSAFSEMNTVRVNGLTGGVYDFARLTLLGGTLVGFDGSANDDVAIGTAFNDSLFGADGADRLIGGAGLDTLSGGNGDDRAAGGGGNDSIRGGTGADALRGGDGSDTLDGGDGADTLRGGGGDDILTGGADADIFDFARANRGGADIVQDFADGVDRLRFTGFGSAGDLLAAAAEVTVEGVVGTRIALPATGGGADGSVVLLNLTLAQLDISDFVVG